MGRKKQEKKWEEKMGRKNGNKFFLYVKSRNKLILISNGCKSIREISQIVRKTPMKI